MDYLSTGKFLPPVQREEVSRVWAARGYSCDLFIDPPGREWNNFVHSCNELVTVMQGELRLLIGGEEVIAKPGDEVFIPKNLCHSVKNICHTPTHWLYGYD